MKKIIVCTVLFFCLSVSLVAQEFIPLWQDNMPNSRRLSLTDSIFNERIHQVAIPGMHVFVPSGEENMGAAVLIVPGGGYVRLAHLVSGWQLAKWFNTFGVTAFVLSHRFPVSPDVIVGYQAPLQDAQRAMRLIRSRASEYGIDPDRVGVMGSSAGGHVAACLSTLEEDWGQGGDKADRFGFRPDFTLLVSPVISMGAYAHRGSRENLLGTHPSQELLALFSCERQVTSDTPPAFLVHADNDNAVSSMNSVLYYTALKEQGVKKAACIFSRKGNIAFPCVTIRGVPAPGLLLRKSGCGRMDF
ncbi:MAG: alpha/beta hydrolase [Bacteroides sp.]|nr:alpha/beta hydrolase [Bacteroides sp.]